MCPLARATCLFHVESLSNCLKYVPEIAEWFKVIIKVINFLVAKPLNKHLLKEFLKEACPALFT
jgi:hypothetical protein